MKVNILFYSTINMKIKFHFNIIDLKDEHFHVNSNRFYKIAYMYEVSEFTKWVGSR